MQHKVLNMKMVLSTLKENDEFWIKAEFEPRPGITLIIFFVVVCLQK